MSEFREVERPDGIGLGGGVWEMHERIRKKKSSPRLCGGRVSTDRFHFTFKIQMLLFIVVECCCSFIIYYCWQAPSAYLLSRAGEMDSFVKNSCFVHVNGLSPRPACFVVGSFFHLRTLLLIAQARCLSVGWSWRASRMTIFLKNSLIS